MRNRFLHAVVAVFLFAGTSIATETLETTIKQNLSRYGIEYPLDKPDTKTRLIATQSAVTGLPQIAATFESADPWLSGVNWGGVTFGGSLDKGENFFGSSLTDIDLVPVEIRFSSTETTIGRVFRRDLSYADNGVGTFPGSAWDMSNPSSPRRLNICFVEDAAQKTPNAAWDPSSSSLGDREYLFVMLSSYDGDGSTYAGFNAFSGASTMDILYGYWPKTETAYTFLQSEPATLTVGVYYIKNFRAIPDSAENILTWRYDDTDVDHFQIYGGTTPNPTTPLASVSGTERTYTHSSLVNGTPYYYKIEGQDMTNQVLAVAPEISMTPQSVSSNMNLLGFWHERSSYGDIWGYTDNGTEYALMCARDEGVSIIDITANPPVEVGFIPSITPGTDAKDVKIYQNYAIIVKESEPIQIVDLSDVTNPVQVSTFTPDGGGSHNCLVEGDYLYVIGNHGTGGLEIVDISNPAIPTEVGQFQPFYYHDIDIRNDTVCATGIYGDGIDLIDVSNKALPTLVHRFNYSGSGAHNAEYSTDGSHVFIGDEIGSSGNHIRVFDITNPTSVTMASEIIVNPSAVVHNCYVLDDTLLMIGHYTEGLRIWNIVDPVNPFEIAYYDSYIPANFGYSGVWSVYPYFASGKIVISDMQTGLYVLEMNPPAPPICCLNNRGNVNGDVSDILDISDLLYLVDYFFLTPPGPAPVCDIEADVDGSGQLDISDLLYLVDYFFLSPAGPAPVTCQ